MNTSLSYEPEIGQEVALDSVKEEAVSQKMLTSLREELDEGKTSIFTRMSPEDTFHMLEKTDALFLDLDGTCIQVGATNFPPGFVQLLSELRTAGTQTVFVTGKPREEIMALMETVPKGLPLSFIFERGAYRLDRDADGVVAYDRLLATAESERDTALLRETLLGSGKLLLETKHGVSLWPSGYGTHTSVVSVDVCLPGVSAADVENDASPGRSALKMRDARVLHALESDLRAMLPLGWWLTNMHNSSFELHPASLGKKNALLATFEYQKSESPLVCGDSTNDAEMFELAAEKEHMHSGVIFTRHTPVELVEMADIGVAGEAAMDVILREMREAKGIQEKIVVISNTPPIQKKGSGFVVSAGAPVAISTAVEGVEGAQWMFPHQTPDVYREAGASEPNSIFSKLIPVGITPAQHRSHYGSIANKTLWKSSHPDAFEKPPAFPQEDWDNYVSVNRALARTLREQINGSAQSSLLWVHDFQVAPLAMEVDNLHLTTRPRMGFFWHIPFPDARVFLERLSEEGRGNQRAKQLLTWFSKYDVVGFHTQEYVDHYKEACSLVGVPAAKHVLVQPISIDVDSFVAQARSIAEDPSFRFELGVLNTIFELSKDVSDREAVVLCGAERADPIKGSVPRLQALLELAKQHPELFDGKRFLEILLESRTATDPLYETYYNQARSLIDDINDALGHTEKVWHVPKVEARKDMAGITFHSRYAMYTSIADGFNMSCPEALVSWKGTRDLVEHPRRMFVSDRTGFAKSLSEKGYTGAVPLARGPITVQSLMESQKLLLSDQLPEPDYDVLDRYFSAHTIQKWVTNNIRAIRYSGRSWILSLQD